MHLPNDEELDNWGNDSIDYLLLHFGQDKAHTYANPLTKEKTTYDSSKLVDSASVKEEWCNLKKVVKMQQYPCHSMSSLWSLIMQFHKDDFPNISLLAALALSHPIHTADCERAFSAQNHVISPLRNRLSPEHCDQLMRLMIEGGGQKDPKIDFNAAVKYWREKKDRHLFRS